MTPAARMQATIDLLGAIEDGPAAADRIVTQYFRARRYAGAKDRRAISDRLYAILRRRAALAWWLAQSAIDPSPRWLALADLTATDRLPAKSVTELFAGGRFGPVPLTEDEGRALGRLAESVTRPPPAWADLNCPEWLLPAVQKAYNGDWQAALEAANGRAPLDLRTNLLKTDRPALLAALAAEGVAAAPAAHSPVGLRLTGHPAVTNLRLYRDGHFEVQDEGSQLAAHACDVRPGHQVVDYCAGAGGKTLALAALMENRGQIHAADVSRPRLAALRHRGQRAGVRNVQVHDLSRAGPAPLADLAAKADRVLVDAPCSGTGTWRRSPELRWRLTPGGLEAHQRQQQQLLGDAAALVRPGGCLIYVTCSFLPAENEDCIEAFLTARPDFRPRPIADIFAQIDCGQLAGPGPYLSLMPHRHGTDGFFVAVLERQA